MTFVRLGIGDQGQVPGVDSVMCACARLAMNSSSAGGMTWSAVPIMAHDPRAMRG
jgi:hypothetical protein